MINQQSVKSVSSCQFSSRFYRPDYGGYCFAHLPGLIKRLFGIQSSHSLPEDVTSGSGPYDRVILFVVDAFGWKFFEKYHEKHPFLKELHQGGTVSMLTSMFPSTTAAHLTTIHTGLPVAQSGIFEWFFYEPVLDSVIAPLMFSLAGYDRDREELARWGLHGSDIFPEAAYYQELRNEGVSPYVFNHMQYAYSTFSRHVGQGAKVNPYLTWPQALTDLRMMLNGRHERSYYYLYYSLIDTMGHHSGPDSPHFEEELLAFLDQMHRFLSQIKGQKQRTLMLITADHGQVHTDPHRTFYLNQRLPQLSAMLRKNKQGQLIPFGGSPRDLFLYIQPERLVEAQQLLAHELDGIAEVYLTEELVSQKLFGSEPLNPRLSERMGNLVILPFAGEAVYWYQKGRFDQRYYGHHGGLTPEELFIPLAAYEL